jgi:hypothetical protein
MAAAGTRIGSERWAIEGIQLGQRVREDIRFEERRTRWVRLERLVMGRIRVGEWMLERI